jgi:O-antigen/teichoic acid export membrane protein
VSSIFTMTLLGVAQMASHAGIALIGTLTLGPAGRGVTVIATTLGGFLAFAGGLGTGPALRAQYPSATDGERRALVSAYTWWSATGAVVAPLAAIACAAASAPFIDAQLAGAPFLLALGVFTATQLVMNQFVEAWYADGHYARAVGSAAATGVGSVMAVLVCLGIERTPTALLLAQAVGAAAVCAIVGARLHAAGLLALRRPCRCRLTSLVRIGIPAMGVNVGLAIVLRADRYLLGVMSGPAAVGVYSLAATLSEIPRVVPAATGQVLMREAAVGGGVAVGGGAAVAGRLLRIAVLGTTAGSLVGGAAGWLLIPRIFGTEFEGARHLLLILLVAEVCFAPYALASRGLLGRGRTATAGSLGMIGAAFGVACYAICAQVGGAAGAAVGSIVVYGGLSAASWVLLRRSLHEFKHHKSKGRER